jgi:hypothetical protein
VTNQIGTRTSSALLDTKSLEEVYPDLNHHQLRLIQIIDDEQLLDWWPEAVAKLLTGNCPWASWWMELWPKELKRRGLI